MSTQAPRPESAPNQPPVQPPRQPQPAPQAPPPVVRPPAPVAWQTNERPSWFKKGFGLGAGGALGAGLVLTGVGIVGSILSGLVLAGIGSALDASASAATVPLETVWGSEDASKTLRAIDVKGPIMASGSDGMTLTASTYGYEVADMIDELQAEDADGLVLLMDTPGGTINGSRAIGEAIERYQGRTGHKVVAYVEGMSASGGMFAMAPADKVIADHGTLVGSIGIISGPFEHYKNVVAVDGGLLGGGVTTTGGITSEYLTQGKGKDFGNPFRAMTAEEREVWMKGLSREYTGFVDWVAKYRKIPAETIRNDLGAHLFDAETAKEKKLVDEVLGREEAFRSAAQLNGLDPDDTRMEAATMPGFFSSLLGAEKRVYGQGQPVQVVSGAPTVVTSVICSGRPQLLAWSGPTAQACGR